jgi:hypothetical protein
MGDADRVRALRDQNGSQCRAKSDPIDQKSEGTSPGERPLPLLSTPSLSGIRRSSRETWE